MFGKLYQRLLRVLFYKEWNAAAKANDTPAVHSLLEEVLGPKRYEEIRPQFDPFNAHKLYVGVHPALYGDLLVQHATAEQIDAFHDAGGLIMNWPDEKDLSPGSYILESLMPDSANVSLADRQIARVVAARAAGVRFGKDAIDDAVKSHAEHMYPIFYSSSQRIFSGDRQDDARMKSILVGKETVCVLKKALTDLERQQAKRSLVKHVA